MILKTQGVYWGQSLRGNGMGGGIGSVLYMERAQDNAGLDSAVSDFYNDKGYLNNGPSLIPEYYAYNAVGSVVANTDQQGLTIRENDFDAYGNVTREQDWTSDNFPAEFGGSQNDLLFSTKERDFSTGLDYFGFRYYDAVLGKFTTRDPSGYPDGSNNQIYCNNNPINCIDPMGLKKGDPWHHGIPSEYWDEADNAGINVDDKKWGRDFDKKTHSKIHSGAGNKNCNGAWKEWLEEYTDNGKKPNAKDFQEQFDKMTQGKGKYKGFGDLWAKGNAVSGDYGKGFSNYGKRRQEAMARKGHPKALAYIKNPRFKVNSRNKKIIVGLAGAIGTTLGAAGGVSSAYDAALFMEDAKKMGFKEAMNKKLGYPPGTNLELQTNMGQAREIWKIENGFRGPDDKGIPIGNEDRKSELLPGMKVGIRTLKDMKEGKPAKMKTIRHIYYLGDNTYGYQVEGSDKVNKMSGGGEVKLQ